MQRYVVILLLFLTTISSAMADTTDDLIQRVDSIMDNISQIYGKKQARIDFYKNMAEKSRKPETLLSAYDKLYDEYFVFQFDSAMVYVDKAIQLADRIGDKYHHDKSRIEKASLLAVGGLYGEAMGLLGEIDSVKLDDELRFTYTITHYYVYTYWADYCHDNTYSPRYRERADSYLKQAVAMLRPTDSYYDFFWGEYYIYVERNDQRALQHYFKTLKTVPVESRWYAMASYAIANNYSAKTTTVNMRSICSVRVSAICSTVRARTLPCKTSPCICLRRGTTTFCWQNATSTLPWTMPRTITTACASSRYRRNCPSSCLHIVRNCPRRTA